MRYLRKNDNSTLVSEPASYDTKSRRPYIRGILLHEQHRFCAYSEKYICEIDESHIEHFDPRLKKTVMDGYYNWYATLPWMNSHKSDFIEDFLPILNPSSSELPAKVYYNIVDNLFETADPHDVEAKRLIEFLGFNKNEVCIVRAKHIKRIRTVISLCGGDTQLALDSMSGDKDNFSFVSALEQVFNIDLTPFITAQD